MNVITGGRGFIGSALSKVLSPASFYELPPGDCKYISGRTGLLIHLAASTNERESFINPAKYIDNNVKNLALLLTNNNFSEIIFPSSTTVYGRCGGLEPSSIYGITKLACEKIIKAYCKKYWILRIANPYGPGDRKSVFARLAFCKEHNEIFTIYNDRKVVRDFFPVDHVVEVITSILCGSVEPGIYNVGSGKETVVSDLLRSICEKHSIRYVIAKSPEGISPGYVTTDNLMSCRQYSIEEEWLQQQS